MNEIVRRIVNRFDPRAVILFGSQARGGADDRSDVDLIVICDRVDDRAALTTEMHASLRGVPAACDIVVYTPDEYEVERLIPGSVARYGSQEGRALYERAA